jgi:quinol monooxygenase YgiN
VWAQVIKTSVKPGMDDRIPELLAQLRAVEQPGSGLLRTTAMRDQADPSRLYLMVMFDSEEHARMREQDPRRQEGLTPARATMAEIFDGPPEFLDLTVIEETTW